MQRLSWTKLWQELNWAMPCWCQDNSREFLDPGPSSGLGEDKAGLLPQWDWAEPSGHERNTEQLGAVIYFYPSKSYHYASSSHAWVPAKAFLVIPWKNPICPGNTLCSRISFIKSEWKFLWGSSQFLSWGTQESQHQYQYDLDKIHGWLPCLPMTRPDSDAPDSHLCLIND